MAVVGFGADPADWAGDDASLLPLSGLIVEDEGEGYTLNGSWGRLCAVVPG